MRLILCAVLLISLVLVPAASAATGRIIKVLPHYFDEKGRVSTSPSLFERDAYQIYLRDHPEKRSGLRFSVHWKTSKGTFEPLKIRVELRGTAEGNLPKQQVLETPVEPSGRLGRWTRVELSGDAHKAFGEVTAWRVTLWEGDQLLGETKSFLW